MQKKGEKVEKRKEENEEEKGKEDGKITGNGACAVIRNVDVSAIASRHVLTYTSLQLS